MSDEGSFQVRPGRVRGTRPTRIRGFVGRVLAAIEKAGGRCRLGRHGSTGNILGSSSPPDDAAELADLRAFTRDLMDQMSCDLSTVLDCVAVDHWDTEHPQFHVLVCGRDDQNKDLIIAHGMRAQASDLVSLELGPRTDREIQNQLDRQVDQERWIRLDRLIADKAAYTEGVVDLRLISCEKCDALAAPELGRLRTLGERNDIIKRLHRELAKRGCGVAQSSLPFPEKPSPIRLSVVCWREALMMNSKAPPSIAVQLKQPTRRYARYRRRWSCLFSIILFIVD